MTKTLIPLASNLYKRNFDPALAELLAVYHDDTELINGDTALQLKLQFTEKQKQAAHERELEAIDFLADCYPKIINGYKYKDILLHALHKDCIEAQLCSFADKRDGQCEALHEVFAGNIVFIEPSFNYIQETFTKKNDLFPLIKELFEIDHSLQNSFLQFPVLNLMEIFQNGKRNATLHTKETLSYDSKIPAYEEWKKITLSTFNNGMDLLTKQAEF